MDPITIGILGALAFMFFKKPTAGAPGGGSSQQTGTAASVKPNLSGAPALEITKIHKFPIDKVDFTLSAGGDEEKADHKAKETTPTLIKVGGYTAIAVTDPKIRDGQKKPDAVVIAVRDAANKVIMSKMVLINDKKILDLV